MSKRNTTRIDAALADALNRFPLRYLAEHTGIDKTRLCRLRYHPAQTRLHELIQLMDGRFIRIRIDQPYGHVRRDAPRSRSKT